MAREIAPTKLTSGSGYAFEDKVTAFFITYLLSSIPPFDPAFGTITKIELQNRVDGWILDDILLHLKNKSVVTKVSLSVKSNRQFTLSTAPKDFVSDAWEQYLGGPASFTQGKDRLGIVTAQLDTETKTKLEDLLKKARKQDPVDLELRIKQKGYVSNEAICLYNSFNCPKSLQEKYSDRQYLPGELLKYVEHIGFDFEHTASMDLSRILTILRDVLKKSDLTEARSLWLTLCGLAKEISIAGGFLNLPLIIQSVREQYKLNDFPDHQGVWDLIQEKTREEIGLIKHTIGPDLVIDRDDIISKINSSLYKNSRLLLLGTSGVGKTVIQKYLAMSKMESGKVVWINSENFSDLAEIAFREISMAVPDSEPLLVIDAIDRFYSERDFRKLAVLIKNIVGDDNKNHWKILISCQPDEWQRVQIHLSKCNVIYQWLELTIENPENRCYSKIWAKYPALNKLSLHLHLQQFFLRPKIIELFVQTIEKFGPMDDSSFESISAQSGQIGESHLIEWFWDLEVTNHEKGIQKSHVLKWLAQKMADDITTFVQFCDIEPGHAPLVEDLLKIRTLRKRNDKVFFDHDLIADWVRQRILIDRASNLYEFLEGRLTSPAWCRALRLFGIYLLETESSIDRWLEVFNKFKEQENGRLGQDILLESAIFSATPYQNLDKLFPLLFLEDGKLLQRFLKRFLYSASYPNHLALIICAAYGNEGVTKILSENRDPYWLYWIPVIQILYSHKKEAQKHCPLLTSKIVDKWLRFSKEDWPARSEAAEIAMELSEDLLALKLSNIMLLSDHGYSESIFRAGIAACKEETDRANAFILTACCRKPPTGNISILLEKYNSEEAERKREIKESCSKIEKRPAMVLPSICRTGRIPDPWPQGPKIKIDYEFRDTCLGLNSQIDALHPLITYHPKIAVEVILALLIEHPEPESFGDSRMDENYGLEYMHGWYPPFYTNGPFLSFLSIHHEHAIQLIVSFINFVTERWAENRSGWEPESQYIEIQFKDRSYKYFGDLRVYYWHRDMPSTPNSIGSALMSLEKWLYDKLENDKTKAIAVKTIEDILHTGKSLAFIGVIISVLKKHQELFVEGFLPLLSVPEFYCWDSQHILVNENHQLTGWSIKGVEFFRLAEKWHLMSHRKVELNSIGLSIFIQNQSTRKAFSEYRKKWEMGVKENNYPHLNPDSVENLILWFDLSNWKTHTDPDKGETLYFETPAEVKNKREKGSLEIAQKQTLLNLPIILRQILDDEREAPKEAEEVWGAIKAVEEIKVDDQEPDKDILDKNNSICGGIAVLFIKYKEWLAENPESKRWCVEKVTNIILFEHVKEQPYYGRSRSNWKWDRFCAEVLPTIWAENPNNKTIRECIIFLATIGIYETVQILFKKVSEYRNSIGDHFSQLNHFIIKYLIHKWSANESRSSKENEATKEWLSNQTKAFVEGDYPVKTESLSDYIKKQKDKALKENPYNERSIDFFLIKSVYDWVPGLSCAKSKNERSEWLALWTDLASITINVIRHYEKEDGEIGGTPSDWDYWIFRKLALQLLDLDGDETGRQFWEPILDLGAPGHYWVSDFLGEWFSVGLGFSDKESSFCERWNEMVEYAFNSKEWESASGAKWFYWPDLWCQLLGMGNRVVSSWKIEKKAHIDRMAPHYNRWAESHFSDPKSAIYYMNFLMQPACSGILINGIVAIEKASKNNHFFTDRHYKVQNPLATFLEFSWEKYGEEIRNNAMSYDSFKKLLCKLVDLQNTQAIEFQQNKFSR